jgi:hypothetical protein
MRVPGIHRTRRAAVLRDRTSASAIEGGSRRLYTSLKCMSSKPAVCSSRCTIRTGSVSSHGLSMSTSGTWLATSSSRCSQSVSYNCTIARATNVLLMDPARKCVRRVDGDARVAIRPADASRPLDALWPHEREPGARHAGLVQHASHGRAELLQGCRCRIPVLRRLRGGRRQQQNAARRRPGSPIAAYPQGRIILTSRESPLRRGLSGDRFRKRSTSSWTSAGRSRGSNVFRSTQATRTKPSASSVPSHRRASRTRAAAAGRVRGCCAVPRAPCAPRAWARGTWPTPRHAACRTRSCRAATDACVPRTAAYSSSSASSYQPRNFANHTTPAASQSDQCTFLRI